MLYLPWILKTVKCPVIGCPEVAHSAGQLREHFMFRHFFLWIAVVQEGGGYLNHFYLCGMHMP